MLKYFNIRWAKTQYQTLLSIYFCFFQKSFERPKSSSAKKKILYSSNWECWLKKRYLYKKDNLFQYESMRSYVVNPNPHPPSQH